MEQPYKYKIGEILLCINDTFAVDTNASTYTKGKEYTIAGYHDMWFPYIVPDNVHLPHMPHCISENYLEKNFKVITREKKLKRILFEQ